MLDNVCSLAALALLAVVTLAGSVSAAGETVRVVDGAALEWLCEGRVCRSWDVAYGLAANREDDDPLLLDVYRPHPRPTAAPAIVFIHGGGWQVGSKDGRRKDANYVAERGLIGVTIDYRLSGEARYPAAIHDSKAAIRWLRGHAQELGIDPDRIVAAGGSAGSQLSSFLGVTNADVRFEGDTLAVGVDRLDAETGARIIVGSSEIAAAAPQSSTVDFAFQCKHMKADWPQPGTAVAKQQKLWPSGGALWLGCECFDQDIDGDGEIEPGYETGCPELWEEASPAAHVAADSVPHAFYSPAPDLERPGCVADGGFATFFRTCGSDAFRSDLHARNMAAALERAGVYNRLYLVSGGDHVFHRVEPWFSRVLDDLLAFVDACVVRSDCDALAPPDASPGE